MIDQNNIVFFHLLLCHRGLEPVPACIRKTLTSCLPLHLLAVFCTSSSFVSFSLRGRFSVITLCRDVETSQVFAAKITPYQAEQRQLVLREYQLLKRLHHPHLVQLHSAYITPRYMVLVEELCPGKELLYSLAMRYRAASPNCICIDL